MTQYNQETVRAQEYLKYHPAGFNSSYPVYGMHHCWLMCMEHKFFAMYEHSR